VFCVDADLGYSPSVVSEAGELANAILQADKLEDVTTAASRLRHFWIGLELRGEGPQHLMRALQGLLQLLVENLGDLVADDRWVHGQVAQIQTLLAQPLTPALIEQAERNFKEYLLRQGTLKEALDEARAALRDMMAALVARMGTISSSTGEYAGKLSAYSERIRSARDLSDISEVLGSLLMETQNMHGDMARTHGELHAAQDRVQQHEQRVRELETQLADLSQRMGADTLTDALNRRGLDQQYSIEESRIKRKNAALCLAVLDVDNFKQINDRLGHAAGDNALRHLVDVVRQVIRPTDSVARYGGEEFVILLPETTMDNAERVMIRVQRELTKRFFMHNNERILITFSAGIAERRQDETQEQVIGRADAAMYAAKRAGKNRVQRAD
jgi:diguanylate cyclase